MMSLEHTSSIWIADTDIIIIKNNLVIGLKPFVTIFHWDTPQALESNYKGFLSENIMYVPATCHLLLSGTCHRAVTSCVQK